MLKAALANLEKRGEVLKISSVYKTSSYGPEKQDDFLNIAAIYSFNGSAERLLEFLKEIEIHLGREKTYHWGPRVIDIDIVDYEGPPIKTETLIIPHIEMHKRKFVLIPLKEIYPAYISRSGIPIKQLIMDCPDNGEVDFFKMDIYGKRWL